MQPYRLHPEREHRNDDLLDWSLFPWPGERDRGCVIGNRLRALANPDDVRLRQADRLDLDIGEAVVHEVHVFQDVFRRLAAEDRDLDAGIAARHLLRDRRSLGHRWFSDTSTCSSPRTSIASISSCDSGVRTG